MNNGQDFFNRKERKGNNWVLDLWFGLSIVNKYIINISLLDINYDFY